MMYGFRTIYTGTKMKKIPSAAIDGIPALFL